MEDEKGKAPRVYGIKRAIRWQLAAVIMHRSTARWEPLSTATVRLGHCWKPRRWKPRVSWKHDVQARWIRCMAVPDSAGGRSSSGSSSARGETPSHTQCRTGDWRTTHSQETECPVPASGWGLSLQSPPVPNSDQGLSAQSQPPVRASVPSPVSPGSRSSHNSQNGPKTRPKQVKMSDS